MPSVWEGIWQRENAYRSGVIFSRSAGRGSIWQKRYFCGSEYEAVMVGKDTGGEGGYILQILGAQRKFFESDKIRYEAFA